MALESTLARLTDWARRLSPAGRLERRLRTLLGPMGRGKLLGRGREGYVFALDSGRVIKIIFSRTRRDPALEREAHEKKRRIISENRLHDPPFLVNVWELGEIRADDAAYPFQICERIEGRTLSDELKNGAILHTSLRDRLVRLIELVAALERLADHNLNFVHIDDRNLMVEPHGRWRLIDFDALELGEMDFKTRKRFMRRLARVILDVLANDWKTADFGSAAGEVRRTMERLKIMERTPKGERPERGTTFKTLSDLRAALDVAVSALREPANAP